MKNFFVIIALVIFFTFAPKKSDGQFTVVKPENVNPFLKKDTPGPETAAQFGVDLFKKEVPYLRVSYSTYITAAAKALKSSTIAQNAYSHLDDGEKTAVLACAIYTANVEIEYFEVDQLEGVSVLGVMPGDSQIGMFPAYKAGSYAVHTTEDGKEIILYKAGCLNICIDNRVIKKTEPLLYQEPAPQPTLTACNCPAPVNNNYYTSNTTNNYTYEMEPFRRPDVTGVPVYIIEDDEPAPVLGSAVIFNNGGGRSGGGIGVNLAASFLGGMQQRGCQPVYQQQQQQPVWRPQSGPTWTGFVTPPGEEGYGGGTYTPIGPIDQPTGGGNENYPGGTWTGM